MNVLFTAQNEVEIVNDVVTNEGTRRLDFIVYLIQSLSVMPVSDRPWNVANQKTKLMNDAADQFLKDENMFDKSSFPEKEIPKASTLIRLMDLIHDSSMEVAQQYEKKMEALVLSGDIVHRNPYTLLVDPAGTVLEVDDAIFNMKVAGFNKKQVDYIKVTGSEERAVTAANLRLSTEILKLGQTELIDYEKTKIGRKALASKEQETRRASKDQETTNAEV